MSAEHCPNCGAEGVGCGCAPGAGFDPLRIRPYVSLSDPGQAGGVAAPSPQPVLGALAGPYGPPDDVSTQQLAAVAPPPHAQTPPPADAQTQPHAQVQAQAPDGQDTPAYGIPVPPAPSPWPDHQGPHRAAVPPTPEDRGTGRRTNRETRGGGGGGGGPEKRRNLPLLLAGAAAVVVLGGAALAFGVPGSGSGDTTLLDAKPSAPPVSIAPGGPSEASPSATADPSASASVSRSPSPSASRSPSPSASPSASRTSAPPRPSPSPSRTTAAPPPPPAAQGPTLRYGDSGPDVKRLQQLLSGQGLYRGKFDGKYGKSVEDGVSEFQWYNDIHDDPWGVYGPATRKALEAS